MLFSDEEQIDADYLILVLLLMFEWQKGDDSFWKPYLDVLPEVQLFCHWEEDEIAAAEDLSLMQSAETYKDVFNE